MVKFRTSSLIISTIFLSLLLFHIPTAFGESEGPLTEQVRTTVEKVLVILENSTQDHDSNNGSSPNSKRDKTKKGLVYQKEIREAIIPQFDFPEMARRSLGLNWRPRTPNEREEFIELFSGLMEDFFSDKIKSFEDEKFVYMKEVQDGKYAKVYSMIVKKDGEEITINYMFHHVGENWKVYDMVIEHVSLVKNYRSQFNRIIANASYQELVRRMKRVTKK